MRCQYCGQVTAVPQQLGEIRELVFEEFANKLGGSPELEKDKVVHCNNCGAEFSLGPTKESDACPFCGSNVVVPAEPEERIPPGSLLPFHLDRKGALASYQQWLKRLWLAPNDLKRNALSEGGLRGMYIPYWTYDANTTTDYVGQRGEHYWVTETYTEYENGRAVTKTRQVRRTRWYPASGTVFVTFDDVLVLASNALPPKHASSLRQWDLSSLTPYEPSYLAGFQTMRYDVGLVDGFAAAKQIMQPTIHSAICRDIGGDEQQVHSKSTAYHEVTFKLLLLPIWVGAYRYRGKTYQYLVNARTGEVRGDAPVSWIKVTLLVLLGLIVVGLFIWFGTQGSG